jgi:D-alanine-D-alanine ligase
MREAPDLAFNIAEGRQGPGRESIVPAVLELLGIPYTGSDAVTLGVSLNKALTKRLASSVGVPTPPFRLFASAQAAQVCRDELDYPVLLKPNLGGSSAGIGPDSVVRTAADLPERVERMLAAFAQPCLAEGYVSGVDVTVGLLGNGDVEVLPIGRVETAGGMYSAAAKRRHDRRIVCPCALPDGLRAQLTDWSLRVYRLIGARDFARVDYMLDERGQAHFLEINPLPGLSPFYGVFPELAAAAGYDHAGLIAAIMDAAIERNASHRSLTHEPMAR